MLENQVPRLSSARRLNKFRILGSVMTLPKLIQTSKATSVIAAATRSARSERLAERRFTTSSRSLRSDWELEPRDEIGAPPGVGWASS